ncbi:MAG: HEAT repeat domain-containing protein [Planctomycetes bacterium]|nr:HEAT repeat domain-containing protein [Planctomycetota bacterium]
MAIHPITRQFAVAVLGLAVIFPVCFIDYGFKNGGTSDSDQDHATRQHSTKPHESLRSTSNAIGSVHSSSGNISSAIVFPTALKPSAMSGAPRNNAWLALRDPSRSEGERNALLNDLRNCGDLYVLDEIWAMIQDPALSDRWRGFCVQHLAEYHLLYRDERSSGLLFSITMDSNTEVRASAVFSFARVAWKYAEAGNEQLADDWDRVIGENICVSSPISARVAAVRGIGLTRSHKFICELLRIAQDASEPLVIKKAALDSIGSIGGKEDYAILSQISLTSSSKTIRMAAARALQRIRTADNVLISADGPAD